MVRSTTSCEIKKFYLNINLLNLLTATYTIVPYEAALYFNKIQCFCFEEQRLEPGEEVDMPVFFYIDDQYVDDPKLQDQDEICLSYTFFESKGSENDFVKAPEALEAVAS